MKVEPGGQNPWYFRLEGTGEDWHCKVVFGGFYLKPIPQARGVGSLWERLGSGVGAGRWAVEGSLL